MLHSCGRHYGGQIAGAQQCHPYASYASWDGSCRRCPGDDEKEEVEAKEGSKFLGATMVANWEEAAIWALRQVDGRTPTRGPAIILQFHKNASRNVRRVTKQGGPENPAARHKFPESLGTRPEACCDVETSFQWWQILNPAIWHPGGQDYHRQVSSRCVAFKISMIKYNEFEFCINLLVCIVWPFDAHPPGYSSNENVPEP